MKKMKPHRLDKFNLDNIIDEQINNINSSQINNSEENLNEDDLFYLVKLDESIAERITSEPYSYWKSVMRTFIRKPAAITAIVSLILLVLGIIIIPMFTPAGYLDFNLDIKDMPPNAEHLWGTDLVGRDLFFITWKGAGKSIGLALISSGIIVTVGTVFGLIWGYFRKLDPIFIEFYNLVSNIPALLLYMLLSYVFMQAFPQVPVEVRLIVSLTLTGWIGLARFVRNQVLIINNREYNVASKTLGTPPSRMMFKNLLPFILAVVVTNASLIIPGMISSEVSMSFFGVGLPSNAISIGALLDLGRQKFTVYPFQLFAPAGLLAFIIFTFFLLGLALTDALDPKKHR